MSAAVRVGSRPQSGVPLRGRRTTCFGRNRMRPHGARIRGLLVLTSISAALLAGVLTAGPAFAVANLAANPSTVAPGGTTTITGGGVTGHPRSTITATDNGNPSRSASQTITVGGSGTCTGATLTISPTSVAPGQQVTLSGTGYNPNQTVTFREDNVATGITTNSGTGSWTYTAIASNVSGSHTVTATDTGNRCGQASYTVTGNSTANCPSGYYYNGSSCVLNNGSATCPAGYTQNGVQCVPCTTGSYPYTQPNPYSQQYPYGQQYPYNYGGCTGAPTTCPPGYIYNGHAHATADPAPPVP